MPATFEYFPFDNQASYETQWREMMQYVTATTGIIVASNQISNSTNDFWVQPGTGLQIKIAVGKAWIKGHFFSHTDDYEYLPISPNSSGSTRTDLLTIRADFTNNTIGYQILQGTTTPVQTTTNWDLPIAQIAVPNGTVSLTAGNITDVREASIRNGWNIASRVFRNTNQPIPNASNEAVAFNSSIYDTHRSWNGSTRLTAPITGAYSMTLSISWASNATGTRRQYIRKNGSTFLLEDQWQPSVAATNSRTSSTVAKLTKGDYIEGIVYQSSGGNLDLGSASEQNPILTMTYLGGV